MNKSPCLDCEHNGNPNQPVCLACDRRIQYIQAIEQEGVMPIPIKKRFIPEPAIPILPSDEEIARMGFTKRVPLTASAEPIASTTRKCVECGEEKPLTKFKKNKECVGGRQRTCKECSKIPRDQRASAALKISREGVQNSGAEILPKTAGNPPETSQKPARNPPETRGPKDQAGKTDWSVFPFQEAGEVARVFAFGASKYGAPFTYRKGIPQAELWAAAMRHMIAHQSGETIDPESGCSHIAHVAANALMMLAQHSS